jgi:hypothetical protein
MHARLLQALAAHHACYACAPCMRVVRAAMQGQWPNHSVDCQAHIRTFLWTSGLVTMHTPNFESLDRESTSSKVLWACGTPTLARTPQTHMWPHRACMFAYADWW